MDAKDELKKALVSEPIKIVVGLALLPLLTWIASIVPEIRDDVWPHIPKVALLLTTILFMTLAGALAFLWRRAMRDNVQIIDIPEIFPNTSDILPPVAMGEADFRPDSRETQILQLLFNATSSVPLQNIQSRIPIQNRQEALYHLERLRKAGFIRSPLKYHRSGTINGYAILQAGREFIVDNGLILR